MHTPADNYIIYSEALRLNINNNNNHEYLECLTCTGPKRVHVFYKYIFVKIQCIQHECTHTHTQTHTHTPVAYQGYQGDETEKKVF